MGTPLISLGPPLVANLLYRGHGKRTMRGTEVQIGNSSRYREIPSATQPLIMLDCFCPQLGQKTVPAGRLAPHFRQNLLPTTAG